jgi:hypothetical protein
MKITFLAAACSAAFVAMPAAAATFAQASQFDTDVSTFIFTNNGNGTSTISGGGQQTFSVMDDDNLLQLPSFMGFDFQPAYATFAGISSHAATGAGVDLQQIIDSGTLTFTNDLGNLLTVTFTNGVLGGRNGGAYLRAGDDSSIGASVTYTSDFEVPDFSTLPDGTDNFVLGLTFNPPSSNLGIGSNGQLASFNASTVGTFNTLAVPEPASWALMIVGFGGLGGLLRVKRRRGFLPA